MNRSDLAKPHPIRTLLHAFPSFEIGGSQIRFAAIANHYGPCYRHVIVAMNGKTECLARVHKEVPHRILAVAAPKNRTIRNFFALRHVLANLKPDALITYNWGSIEWALANIVPICRHIHIEDGFGPDEALTGQLRRRALFRRVVLSGHSRVVLPSKTLMHIASDIWRLPLRHLSYVPNGIDSARFAILPEAEFAATLRRAPDEIVIGTVATLRAEKNITRLISAFATVAAERPARLVIVGDGIEREALQQFAASRGLSDSVLFMGAMTNPEHILGAFDIFALSSNTEQMPFSILEAMAAGLPIAAVDVGDVREMVSPENRPLVVHQSEEGLAAAIVTLARDPKARAVIGRSNRDHVRHHYDQAMMFRRYATLFDGEE